MLKIRKVLNYKAYPIEYDLIFKEQKYIRLKIVDDNIIVSAPVQAQDWEIEHLIYKNINRIIKVIEFREQNKKFEISNPGFVKIFDKKVTVYFRLEPDEKMKDTYKLYDRDELTIKHMYKKMSLEYYDVFLQRINMWKEVMGLDFKNLTVKEMKGKWGICYPDKSKIVLNIRLIHYPMVAMDYVIVHELSHLVHKNHSRSFWNHVQKFLPNYKDYSNLLKVAI
ncbi:zinc metalloprotease [Spiroplasma helicoides]|uniref:Zinc metalloprotease n=1 Tax=Spiroplasma helicoides TaxID=216938 RepID=A0A1B3SJM6_9MOLU|nr:YgjP-like metallopeptidase domain-containing protein [Spiroplasma helicoides]AOG60132.1 zinc metalloprotease [Spiroplasma helicoides]